MPATYSLLRRRAFYSVRIQIPARISARNIQRMRFQRTNFLIITPRRRDVIFQEFSRHEIQKRACECFGINREEQKKKNWDTPPPQIKEAIASPTVLTARPRVCLPTINQRAAYSKKRCGFESFEDRFTAIRLALRRFSS